MAEALLAAVVVTYNRKDILRRTLLAILNQSRPPDLTIVADNNSR
jgi:rhamnopyranosyl-N-acetylglucosaminyl-diphospho-decaprenol beta-1,3/1,4-galactofuranosyltransferase